MNVDPMAGLSYSYSTYNYCLNNPVILIDPNGMYVSWQEGNEDIGKIGETDPFGGDRFDEKGTYIAPLDRSGGDPISDFFEKMDNYARYGVWMTDKKFEESYNKMIEVLIWDKDSDVGHTAIKVDGITYGYYPTDIDGDGAYTKTDLSNSPGEMHIQDSKSFSESYKGNVITSFTIRVTSEQKKNLVTQLTKWSQNPGIYKLWGNQCTSVALKAMAQADIRIKISTGHTLISNAFDFQLIASPAGLKEELNYYNPIVKNKTKFTVK